MGAAERELPHVQSDSHRSSPNGHRCGLWDRPAHRFTGPPHCLGEGCSSLPTLILINLIKANDLFSLSHANLQLNLTLGGRGITFLSFFIPPASKKEFDVGWRYRIIDLSVSCSYRRLLRIIQTRLWICSGEIKQNDRPPNFHVFLRHARHGRRWENTRLNVIVVLT